MQSFTDIGRVAVHNSIRLHASADVLDVNRFLLYFVRFLTSLGPSRSDYGSATAAGVSKYLLHGSSAVGPQFTSSLFAELPRTTMRLHCFRSYISSLLLSQIPLR